VRILMFKLNNKVLIECFWWFGLVCAFFGVITEISGQQIYLSSYFYLEVAVVAFLAGIFAKIKR